MVGKVKRGQLLWTIDLDSKSVIHGHVVSYEKKGYFFSKVPKIKLLLGDLPLSVIHKDNVRYTEVWGSTDGFFLTRKEAIKALIQHKNEEIAELEVDLDVLHSELNRKSKKDVVLPKR